MTKETAEGFARHYNAGMAGLWCSLLSIFISIIHVRKNQIFMILMTVFQGTYVLLNLADQDFNI